MDVHIGCLLRFFAVAALLHAVAAQIRPSCLDLAPANTVGWQNATNQILDYVPASFRSNCGYLSTLAGRSCNANCTNARGCCEAACGYNGAGCGCLGGKFPAFLKSIPIDGALPLTPTVLSQSTCDLGTVYSGSNCKNIPSTGSSICNRIKPATETASCSSQYKTSRYVVAAQPAFFFSNH
jgi:hypothetical protein